MSNEQLMELVEVFFPTLGGFGGSFYLAYIDSCKTQPNQKSVKIPRNDTMMTSVVARKATKLLVLARQVSQGLPQPSISDGRQIDREVEGPFFTAANGELYCLLNEEEQGTRYIAS
jgi:hypothetical protein